MNEPSITQSQRQWNAPCECSSVAPSASASAKIDVAERVKPLGPTIAERPTRRKRLQATTGYWDHREEDAETVSSDSESINSLDSARVEEREQSMMRASLVDGEEVRFRRSWYGAVRHGGHDEFNEHSLAHGDKMRMRNTAQPAHDTYAQIFGWAAFDVAVEYASGPGRAAFGESMQLKLYCLHQQAVVGEVVGIEPADVKGNEQRRARWAAWAASAGTSKLEAREAYIAMVKAACPAFKMPFSQHQGVPWEAGGGSRGTDRRLDSAQLAPESATYSTRTPKPVSPPQQPRRRATLLERVVRSTPWLSRYSTGIRKAPSPPGR